MPVVFRGPNSKYIDTRRKVCSEACRRELHGKQMLEAHADREIVARPARHGYMRVSVRKDPAKKAVEILEHRWRMEQHLGRELLPGETVHHINGDRTDNRIENLELFSSRHGPGQRVTDKVAWAVELLQTYPGFLRQAGYTLTKLVGDVVDVTPDNTSTNSPILRLFDASVAESE